MDDGTRKLFLKRTYVRYAYNYSVRARIEVGRYFLLV